MSAELPPSTARLVAALKALNAPPALVLRATANHFNDFLSDSATPIMDLVTACRRAGLHDLVRRALHGEFDADPGESEAWARSPEGQRTFRNLRGPHA